MTNRVVDLLIKQSYDCLILVHPHIDVLGGASQEIQGSGVAQLNVGKELSCALMSVSPNDRSSFSQNWLIDSLSNFHDSLIVFACLDLLFDPSLKIDPLTLLRQAARLKKIIVLWPGEYSANNLSYAVPEHHHFRTWKITDSLLQQPVVMIQRILIPQGV